VGGSEDQRQPIKQRSILLLHFARAIPAYPGVGNGSRRGESEGEGEGASAREVRLAGGASGCGTAK